MKRPVLFILILLSACKPGAYIVSPNEVHKEKVMLYLRNGEKITGEINIDLESNSSQHIAFNPLVEILPEGKTVWRKFNMTEIAAYAMGPDYYPVKNLDVNLNGSHSLMFVKRLTPENSKIQFLNFMKAAEELKQVNRSIPI